MSKRLTAEREAEIRDEHSMVRQYAEDHDTTMCSEGVSIGELLAEIDALRSERDQAVERERERCAQPIRARLFLLEREELNWQHAGDYHNEGRVRSVISALSDVLSEICAEHVQGKEGEGDV